MVTGTVTNTTGNETGVTVNGIVAVVYNGEFFVNHVPLEEGENTITATATDIDGNVAIDSITVNAVTTGNYIKLISNIESGIPPLEVILRIDGSFYIEASLINVTGPGQIEWLYSSADEYRVRMTVEGVYYFTAEATDAQSITYTDTIAIVVLNAAELDALLQAKWEAMKIALGNQDVNGALSYFAENSKDTYQYNFELMQSMLPTIVQDMGDIVMTSIEDKVAEYEMNTVIEGTVYNFYIKFIKDLDGIWKIYFF